MYHEAMIPIHVESAWKGTSDCRSCGIRHMVLFADLNEEDFSQLHTPIDDMHFEAGRPIYLEGDPAKSVYTLRTGMVKLVRTMLDGRQRIVRVLRPGDVIGCDELAPLLFVLPKELPLIYQYRNQRGHYHRQQQPLLRN